MSGPTRSVGAGRNVGTKHPEPYRGPRQTGAVLVFSATGWYRHPETAAVAGWLARLLAELGMQVDVTESPKDIVELLPRYKVLVLNNSNELDKVLAESERELVQRFGRLRFR